MQDYNIHQLNLRSDSLPGNCTSRHEIALRRYLDKKQTRLAAEDAALWQAKVVAFKSLIVDVIRRVLTTGSKSLARAGNWRHGDI